MRAKDESTALVEALDYYQKRLLEVETDYKKMKERCRSLLTVL